MLFLSCFVSLLGNGLTSSLSSVMSNCDVVTLSLVSCVMCVD